jgi:hypothetical protein
VNDIEAADEVFHGIEALDERAAHIVDFIDETRIQGKTAAMVMHAVDFIVFLLSRPNAGENVNFMPPTLHSRGKFGDVDANSAHGNRVKCFPREHCYPHEYIAPFHACLIFRVCGDPVGNEKIFALWKIVERTPAGRSRSGARRVGRDTTLARMRRR